MVEYDSKSLLAFFSWIHPNSINIKRLRAEEGVQSSSILHGIDLRKFLSMRVLRAQVIFALVMNLLTLFQRGSLPSGKRLDITPKAPNRLVLTLFGCTHIGCTHIVSERVTTKR